MLYRQVIPCGIHGHHNRNHRIITHLNTRISLRSLVHDVTRSLGQTTHRKEPGPIFRPSHSHGQNINRCTHPDAPKPIHPDKEQFCSSTLKLGANIRLSFLSDLFRNRWSRKPKLDFPHKQSRPLTHMQMVEMDGIEPTTPCLQSRCSTN